MASKLVDAHDHLALSTLLDNGQLNKGEIILEGVLLIAEGERTKEQKVVHRYRMCATKVFSKRLLSMKHVILCKAKTKKTIYRKGPLLFTIVNSWRQMMLIIATRKLLWSSNIRSLKLRIRL